MLNLLGGLLGGQGGALKTISKVVDELHTSEEEKLDKKILMQRIQQKLAEKQLDVNAKEASHRSVFVAGWRPAIGWCGAMALFFAFILSPCIEWYAKFSGIASAIHPQGLACHLGMVKLPRDKSRDVTEKFTHGCFERIFGSILRFFGPAHLRHRLTHPPVSCPSF